MSDTASESGTGHVTTGDRGGGVTDLMPVLEEIVLVVLGHDRFAQRVRQAGQELPKYFAPGRANCETHKDIGLYAHVVDSSFLGLLEPLTPRRP